jgi:hypothetical protein
MGAAGLDDMAGGKLGFSVQSDPGREYGYFQQGAVTRLFQVGHNLEVLSLEGEDERMGVIVKAKAKGQMGQLPLADLEVKPKTDRNYWPVREYVVWFANR